MTPQEAINTLNSIKQYYNDKNEDSYVGFDKEDNEAIDMAIKALEQQPRMGHWIKLEPYPLQMHEYECSECGHETDDNTENYCSECGAKMEVDE